MNSRPQRMFQNGTRLPRHLQSAIDLQNCGQDCRIVYQESIPVDIAEVRKYDTVQIVSLVRVSVLDGVYSFIVKCLNSFVYGRACH